MLRLGSVFRAEHPDKSNRIKVSFGYWLKLIFSNEEQLEAFMEIRELLYEQSRFNKSGQLDTSKLVRKLLEQSISSKAKLPEISRFVKELSEQSKSFKDIHPDNSKLAKTLLERKHSVNHVANFVN